MSYLLDTNVLSELRKRPGMVNPQVVSWARSRLIDELFISVITVLEIEIGVARVERRDPKQGAMLRAWFSDGVLEGFAGRILSVDLDVVRRTAPLHVPDVRPERDAFIAGTAVARGLTVVTRNTSDFDGIGVPILNPWLP